MTVYTHEEFMKMVEGKKEPVKKVEVKKGKNKNGSKQ